MSVLYMMYADMGGVKLRQKSTLTIEDDDDNKSMRRISYLRATANDGAFQMDSEDSSPVSLQLPDKEVDTPETDEISINANKT